MNTNVFLFSLGASFADSAKQFFTKTVTIGGTAIPTWAFIVADVVLILILILICVGVAKSNKKRKAAKQEAAPAAPAEKQEPVEEKTPEDKADEPFKKAEPDDRRSPGMEKLEARKAAEDAGEPYAPVYKEEPVKQTTKQEAPAKKKQEPAKPATTVRRGSSVPTAANESRRSKMEGRNPDDVFGKGVVEDETPAVVAKPAEKKPAQKAAKKPAAPKAVEKEVAATDKKGAVGKFEICNSSVGGFRYLLIANNGQLLYESRDYKTFDGCKDAIEKFIAAVEAGDFRVRGDKFGNFKYNLKSKTSNNVVFVGESYDSKRKCESAVESVKRFASTAKIVDITEADFVAASATFDIPADVKKEVALGKGAIGRWEITTAADDENDAFVYLLYANNGQLLYESRDYKTADSCRSGLDTFLKTIQDGEFIVDSDKFGRYRFILRKSGNQVEYVGQNYNDKQAAIRSAVSVYKFALLTPVEL